MNNAKPTNSLITIIAIIFSISSLQTYAKDIEPVSFSEQDRYVRITSDTDKKLVSFEDCIKGEEARTCVQIGQKKFYSLAELQSQRTEQQKKLALAIGGDIVVAAAGLAAGAMFGAGAAFLSSSTPVLSQYLGAIIVSSTVAGGVVTTGIGAKLLDSLNPIEQNSRIKTLNKNVISDEQVQVASVDAFIKRLTIVLNGIE